MSVSIDVDGIRHYPLYVIIDTSIFGRDPVPYHAECPSKTGHLCIIVVNVIEDIFIIIKRPALIDTSDTSFCSFVEKEVLNG